MLFALMYLWFPICCSQIREEFKSTMSFRSRRKGWVAVFSCGDGKQPLLHMTRTHRFESEKQKLISTGCACLPAPPKLCISCCCLFEISIIIIWHEDVTTELQLMRKIRGNRWKIKWENSTLGNVPLSKTWIYTFLRYKWHLFVLF